MPELMRFFEVPRCITSATRKTGNQSTRQTINAKTVKLPDRMPDVRTKWFFVCPP
jgi:hypothetical protein